MTTIAPQLFTDVQALLDSGTLSDAETDEVEALLASLYRDLQPGAVGSDASNPKYQTDPIAWMHEQMGIPLHTLRWMLNVGYESHRWDGTKEPLVAICEALARWESVGVESATGTGKTFLGALLVLWFLSVFPGCMVITAAPKRDQLQLHIWKEIGNLWPRFKKLWPEAELTTLRIRMRPTDNADELDDTTGRPRGDAWSAQGFVAGVGADEQVATKAAGFHAEHMLIITEETPGVHPAIMAAFENTCTAPHNLRLAFGNPDHQLDELHLFCESPDVTDIRISAYDHPNVVSDNPAIVPGAVSRHSIERRGRKYGTDSALFGSRVRGISPTEAVDALIKLSWLRDAVTRARDVKVRKAAMLAGLGAAGVDVANSEAGDRGSVAYGQGALLEEVASWPCPNANKFGELHVASLIGRRLPADRVGIDSVGVGVGAFNELTRLGHNVVGLNGGAGPVLRPDQEEVFQDLRSQMYWTFRQELFHGEVLIESEDQELFKDLVTPKWGTRKGKIFVESKEDLKKRLPGGRSPDKGDAAVYWNWMRKDRGIADPYGPGLTSTSYPGR